MYLTGDYGLSIRSPNHTVKPTNKLTTIQFLTSGRTLLFSEMNETFVGKKDFFASDTETNACPLMIFFETIEI